MAASEAGDIGATGAAVSGRSARGAFQRLGGVGARLATTLGALPGPAWAAGGVLLAVAAIAGWVAVAKPPPPREIVIALPPALAPEPAPTEAPAQNTTATEAPAPAPVPVTDAEAIDAVSPRTRIAEHESVIEPRAARAGADDFARAAELAPVPHPDLVEQGRSGPLPRIAPDGRRPWQVYARPFDDTDARPRIAVVIGALGMRRSTTFQAIELPGTVTLAFAPYADGLGNWIDLARDGAHEILLELPMEPETYPRDDPGPRALLTGLGVHDNLQRLEWLLSRFVGYVGVIPFQGTAFTGAPGAFGPIVAALRDRGLLYLDRGSRELARTVATENGLPWVSVDLRVDATPSREAIAAMLAEAERIAFERQSAVVIAEPLPLTLSMIADWLAGLEDRGIAPAPVTAVFARRAGA